MYSALGTNMMRREELRARPTRCYCGLITVQNRTPLIDAPLWTNQQVPLTPDTEREDCELTSRCWLLKTHIYKQPETAYTAEHTMFELTKIESSVHRIKCLKFWLVHDFGFRI
jgi:hypothetical protein